MFGHIAAMIYGETTMLQESVSQERSIEWLRHAAAQSRPLFEERRRHGWEIARRAAERLRERYGVTRVRVFGSLLYPSRFDSMSDIDLAVEGLDIDSYWSAVADVYFFDDEISVELVDRDSCSEAVWSVVEREGVDI
jgi:predicted nucleotidyltransferase